MSAVIDPFFVRRTFSPTPVSLPPEIPSSRGFLPSCLSIGRIVNALGEMIESWNPLRYLLTSNAEQVLRFLKFEGMLCNFCWRLSITVGTVLGL